jgi:hypothetical protein
MRDGRLRPGVFGAALDTGRGICDGDRVWLGTRRSESRGVEGLDMVPPLLSTITQPSPVRWRFDILDRSSSTESTDNTP